MRITKQAIFILIAIVAVGVLSASQVWAHHAFAAEFDGNRPVKLEGTVVKVQWTNPHSWFHLDVKNAEGQVERWLFEGGSPGSLARRGFTKDYVKPGTELVAEGYLAKGVARRANARSLTFRDGRTLFVGSSGTGAPTDGRDASER